MRYVLDACVAIASVKATEPLFAMASARLERVLTGADQIIVPVLFSVEVTAGLIRAAAADADRVAAFVARLLDLAEVITIGPVRAKQIAVVAVRTRLRAADAAYVWLAAREGVPLVTADNEVHTRAPPVCVVERP